MTLFGKEEEAEMTELILSLRLGPTMNHQHVTLYSVQDADLSSSVRPLMKRSMLLLCMCLHTISHHKDLNKVAFYETGILVHLLS